MASGFCFYSDNFSLNAMQHMFQTLASWLQVQWECHDLNTPLELWKVPLQAYILYLLKMAQTNSLFNFLILSPLFFNCRPSCNKSVLVPIQLEEHKHGKASQRNDKTWFTRLYQGVATVWWIRPSHLYKLHCFCRSKWNIEFWFLSEIGVSVKPKLNSIHTGERYTFRQLSGHLLWFIMRWQVLSEIFSSGECHSS